MALNKLMTQKNAAAAKAKARMAKRAKRARWWKENKRRLTIIFVTLLLLFIIIFLTPLGPDYYYGKIQTDKMSAPNTVSEGKIRDLYKLGVFYDYSMRSADALRMYNEIATLYYGFTFSDYAANPAGSIERRLGFEKEIKRGTRVGPPFKIAESDVPYVGLAIWRAGEVIQKNRSRQYTFNIYRDLYLNDFLEKYPNRDDREVTSYVKGSVERFLGIR